jgi:hypothetical protein
METNHSWTTVAQQSWASFGAVTAVAGRSLSATFRFKYVLIVFVISTASAARSSYVMSAQLMRAATLIESVCRRFSEGASSSYFPWTYRFLRCTSSRIRLARSSVMAISHSAGSRSNKILVALLTSAALVPPDAERTIRHNANCQQKCRTLKRDPSNHRHRHCTRTILCPFHRSRSWQPIYQEQVIPKRQSSIGVAAAGDWHGMRKLLICSLDKRPLSEKATVRKADYSAMWFGFRGR